MCFNVLFSTYGTSVERQRLWHQTVWATPPVSDGLLWPGVLPRSSISVQLDPFQFSQLISGLPAAISLLTVVASPRYLFLDKHKLSEIQRYLSTYVLCEQSRSFSFLISLTHDQHTAQVLTVNSPNGLHLSQLNKPCPPHQYVSFKLTNP